MKIEFTSQLRQDGKLIENIVIPIASDGKFRIYKGKVVGEVDLQYIGLI